MMSTLFCVQGFAGGRIHGQFYSYRGEPLNHPWSQDAKKYPTWTGLKTTTTTTKTSDTVRLLLTVTSLQQQRSLNNFYSLTPRSWQEIIASIEREADTLWESHYFPQQIMAWKMFMTNWRSCRIDMGSAYNAAFIVNYRATHHYRHPEL